MFPQTLGNHGQTRSKPFPVLLQSVVPSSPQQSHEATEHGKASKIIGVQVFQHLLPCAVNIAFTSQSHNKHSTNADFQASHPKGVLWRMDAEQQGQDEDSEDDYSSDYSSGSEPESDHHHHVCHPFDIHAHPLKHGPWRDCGAW
eukprot:TRINITY_DN106305_c0_g1_i1.p2 TRINITY_DN106305_c0_g1~~TRINITY_DN106305_c0_g1_i1.p2  ORF type:complete len:144 (-),score=20.40 TRINITY_DN106305_c0_g1_i1:31-462(-)